MGWKDALCDAFRPRRRAPPAPAPPLPPAPPSTASANGDDTDARLHPGGGSSGDADASGSDGDARRGMSLADLLASVAPPRASDTGRGLTCGGGER